MLEGALLPQTSWNEGCAKDSLVPSEYNAHVHERIARRGPAIHSDAVNSFHPSSPSNPTIPPISRYFEAEFPSAPAPWMIQSEIPTSEEILRPLEAEGDPHLPTNEINKPWESKEQYLGAHYGLLREDSVLPLRMAVAAVKASPYEAEAEYGSAEGVYQNVRIRGVVLSTRGVAVRVAFSLARTGKSIHWEQSKRLISGSLVALTPATDMFQTQCVAAIVAARPLAALQQNPPEIDLFFARADEIELDPSVEWVMVEHRSSFFEAGRHTLLALQKLMTESFPLRDHLVSLERDVQPPKYVRGNPYLDMSAHCAVETGDYENVNILHDLPDDFPSDLDKSQLAALQRILAKRLAIVQGPPGTGKTHVSVEALKVMVKNMSHNDPPIIVTCQTNHALDQLLRHVALFEENFIRVGGRSKDQGVIKARTLFEVRKANPFPPVGGGKSFAIKRMQELTKTIRVLLSPLEVAGVPLDHHLFHQLGLLTQAQSDSMDRGDQDWVTHAAEFGQMTPMQRWLGPQLIPVHHQVSPDDFGFEYEDADLEFEQLKDMEAEACAQDDDIETLKGPVVYIGDNFAGRAPMALSNERVRNLLQQQDMYKIRSELRGAVYKYLQRETKNAVLASFRDEAKHFNDLAHKRKVAGWEQDAVLLSRQKVIGMTTTGFSKYRALVVAIRPRVVLIEEAAETLEPPVIATCVPSLQQLVLVGDHKQLRPHCQVAHLESPPINFNVSMFERLVSNGVEFDSLKRQRRMIPEIRRLLRPIYGTIIHDHKDVKNVENRPPVEGMGGVNSYFFTHDWPETRDEYMSTCNESEAHMIAEFFNYLVLNGEKSDKITVLTFYNGQRKLLLKRLRQHSNLEGFNFKVVTVDSYQGEENDIVLLSLVRSNQSGAIGFLKNDNRLCVALSRAMRGFYLFGNGQLLAGESGTWAQAIEIIAGKRGENPTTPPKMRIGYKLPIMCKRHGLKVFLNEPHDWNAIVGGGCEKKCGGVLSCGHACTLTCHPYEHAEVNCQKQCERTLPCGHRCRGLCFEPCSCGVCIGSRTWSPPRDGDSPPKLDLIPRNAASRTPVSASSTPSKDAGSGETTSQGPHVRKRLPNSSYASIAAGQQREPTRHTGSTVPPSAPVAQLPQPTEIRTQVHVNERTGWRFREQWNPNLDAMVDEPRNGNSRRRAQAMLQGTQAAVQQTSFQLPQWSAHSVPSGNLIGNEFVVPTGTNGILSRPSSTSVQPARFQYTEPVYHETTGPRGAPRYVTHGATQTQCQPRTDLLD